MFAFKLSAPKCTDVRLPTDQEQVLTSFASQCRSTCIQSALPFRVAKPPDAEANLCLACLTVYAASCSSAQLVVHPRILKPSSKLFALPVLCAMKIDMCASPHAFYDIHQHIWDL